LIAAFQMVSSYFVVEIVRVVVIMVRHWTLASRTGIGRCRRIIPRCWLF